MPLRCAVSVPCDPIPYAPANQFVDTVSGISDSFDNSPVELVTAERKGRVTTSNIRLESGYSEGFSTPSCCGTTPGRWTNVPKTKSHKARVLPKLPDSSRL